MDSSKVSRRSFVAASTAGLAGLSGCFGIGQSDPPWGNEAEGGWAVKVGALLPQSGPLSEYAQGMEDGIRVLEKQFPEIPNTDFSVDLEIRDTEGDPETAAAEAESLLDDGYYGIVGPSESEEAEAVSEVLVEHDGAAVSPLTAVGVTRFEDEGRFYSVAPRARDMGQIIGRPLSLNRIVSTSLIYSESRYGEVFREFNLPVLEDRNIELKADVSVDPTESTAESAVEEAMADDPGALIVAANPGQGIPILDTFFDNHPDVPVFLPDRLRIKGLSERVGSELVGQSVISIKPSWDRGALFGSDSDSSDDDNATNTTSDGTATETPEPVPDYFGDFEDVFQDLYDRFPNLYAGQAYDAAMMIGLASISAGEDVEGGRKVADRLSFVAYSGGTQTNMSGYGPSSYYEGIGGIQDGAQNRLTGVTGGLEFDDGIRRTLLRHEAKFDPEEPSGFRDHFPLPASLGA